jgi:hypothetical protein
MADNKTKATDASVPAYLAERANAEQLADCKKLMAMFKKLTGKQPKMWGPSIVGYGTYHYTYDSGRSGDMPLAAFAIRGRQLVVYIDVDDVEQQALLARLGKHKIGKVCLYLKCLADVDTAVLEQLVAGSIEQTKRKYG